MLEQLKKTVSYIKGDIDNNETNDGLISYKVSPLLEELISLLEDVKEDDQETIEFLFEIYDYIGDIYARIGRFSLAAIYHEKALRNAKKLNRTPLNAEDVLYKLLRDRNYYVDDDCEDIKSLVVDIVPIEKAEKIYKDRMNSRRSLKHDPIEMSKEYLSVIDEVEERIEKNRTIFGMGACHEIWHLKFQYLLEKGISWHSPAMLNPRVMFD